MATAYYKFKGKVKWARVRADQLDTKFNDDGEWKIDFYPEDPKLFQSTGIQTNPRNDELGTFFKLRRTRYLSFRKDGKKEEIEFSPAKVQLRDDDGILSSFDGDIGNGSEIILDLAVFDTKKGKGHRFNDIIVTNLVEYKKDSPVSAADTTGSTGASNELDDDIPF